MKISATCNVLHSTKRTDWNCSYGCANKIYHANCQTILCTLYLWNSARRTETIFANFICTTKIKIDDFWMKIIHFKFIPIRNGFIWRNWKEKWDSSNVVQCDCKQIHLHLIYFTLNLIQFVIINEKLENAAMNLSVVLTRLGNSMFQKWIGSDCENCRFFHSNGEDTSHL